MTEFNVNQRHHQGEAFIKKKRDSNNDEDNDAAFLTNKRQRSMADHQEEEQLQPPQTRRMVTDGMGCVGLVERLAQSSHFLAVPSLTTTNLPNPTDEAVSRSLLPQTSPPKLINREESSSTERSMSGSTASSSSVSSARDDRESVFTPMTNTEGGAEIDSPAPLPSSFSQKKGDSVQPPADSSEQSSSSDEWVCRAFGEEACENDIAHRMWSLRRRGFDEHCMRIMDECVYESDDEDFMACPEGPYRKIDMDAAVDEQQEEEGAAEKFDGIHAHEPPLPEPIVVTPERLLL
ncbi:expressed unknown protein [Ectocarpus siliculosus]|uniref:Uncharacterized protein n=1 Tax=Ectocarpus siliculosus TaxID=2880 RepID=D7G2J9_ECTSI|nr:expressed unknown protein [Ectocarpus siliculosus]|eukprot:CBJ26824.1 expressed unknown protein [Ectocarpus siliculosus]